MKNHINERVKHRKWFRPFAPSMLREEVKNQTQIGKDIENIISKGDFATDEIVNELIKNIVFDWGIAIILLVFTVRLLLHPITKRS